MNPDKKYSKMDYEVEIKRLEKRINDLDQKIAIIIIIAASLGFYLLVSTFGGRSYIN